MGRRGRAPAPRVAVVWVYALVEPAIRLGRMRGIGNERLRVVAAGTVAAVVGDLERTPRQSAAVLSRYQQAVQQLADRTTAILPVRFGTCVPHEHELVMILHTRGQTFRKNLRHVRNRVQMTLRVLGTAPKAAANPARATPSSDRASRDVMSRVGDNAGRNYLAARARERADADRIEGFERIRSAIGRWVKDERVEARGQVTSVYHLVNRSSVESYRRALDKAASVGDLKLVVTGPWPPFAFADTW